FGLPFGEEYGGMGADFLTLCLAIEELARVDSSVAITLEAAVGLGAMPIWRYGTEEQKRRWLPPLAAGGGLGGFGATGPGGRAQSRRSAAGCAGWPRGRGWPRSGSPSRAGDRTPARSAPGRSRT